MDYWSSVTCSKYSWSYDVSGFRSEQINIGSSISDLMSGKIKGDGARHITCEHNMKEISRIRLK